MHTSVTPAVYTSPPRQRLRKGRWFGLLLLAIAILLLGGIGWLYWVARSALPQLDGTVRVRGISAPVHVQRDSHGVPTIDAAGILDLFFAQGYVTAQDRLWQMDAMRRFAGGEMSEMVGDSLIQHDREQRILGLRVAARKSIEILPPEIRAHFEAYARGVNAYIETHRDHLPIEFRILGYSPRPWLAEDSTLIAAQMVKDLNHYPYRHALEREKIQAKLGPELSADLYVNSSWRDRLPTVAPPTLKPAREENDEDEAPDNPGVDKRTPLLTELRAGEAGEESDRLVVGSNNWVVSGAHTVTGKPLLSNDMHLGHQMPNLWYEAHLRSGNFDVAGVTLPGLPYVIVGHNQRIAWGFTNIGPTVEDVYIETFNERGQYQTPEGWKTPEHRQEIIHVKGKPDVTVDVTLTRHGPVIPELIPGETRKLALRWTLYEGTRAPFFAVDAAQNWGQFQQAFAGLDAPGQNVVFADVDGNIGYHATGKVPIRASGDGSLPENGSDNTHEWIGYVPYDKLPSVYNSPSGIIATANSRITPDGYPYSISTGWEAPWRSARIYRILESGKKFSAADMLGLQTDIYSECDRYFAERFVYAVDHARNASLRSRQAADLMRAWDGRMSADSAAPTLAYRARAELVRLLLEPKLGVAPADVPAANGRLSWKTYSWGMASIWLENVVQQQPRRWLPDGFASYNELLAAAVDAAASGLEAPSNLSSWKWGTFRPVEIQHPVLGRIPLMQRWTGPGIQPQSGSPYAVKAVSRSHGPSERMTADLADLDQTTLNLVTGEAGNFLSPYYMDQWRAWYEGFTFKLAYTRQAVAAAKQHEFVLEPE